MKKLFLFALAAIVCCLGSFAQTAPALKFNEDGKLKIVQFTDIHYKYGKSGSKKAIENMNAVLDAEQPDFVMITGDLVYAKPVDKALEELTEPIRSRNIPFAIVFGNHDHQFDMTLSQIYDQVQAMPGANMPPRGNVESPDYVIPVMNSDGTRVAAVFYCIDSHSGARMKDVGKYDWVYPEQITWYLNRSKEFAQANGGQPVPALAFLHIPLPEYQYAEANTSNTLVGTKGEDICAPDLNSGLFANMREQGDVFGIFCGHDHDNDFAVVYMNVLLAYGRYSGGDTVYNHLSPKGARVIEISQDKRDIDTWLRLADGSVIQKTVFPADFSKKK